MEDQYLYQLVTESRTGAILRHLTVEAPLLKDHALPVQLPSRTPTMGRVEGEKMQSIRKTTNETQKAKRSKEMSLSADGEWMVDGRRSLVAYRGREGGDYHYGKFEVGGQILDADKM